MKKLPAITDILLTVAASVLCGLGSGFMNSAGLGMDSVGIFYDGIRAVLKLESSQIGTASYVVCIILSVFLFFADRRYVSIGSLIYILTYGVMANAGSSAGAGFLSFVSGNGYLLRLFLALAGMLVLYVGLGIFIAVDIGVDAFTGLMLFIRNLAGGRMDVIKIIFDIVLSLVGIVLGGKFGLVSVISIFAAGPAIAFFTMKIQAVYFRNKLH